MKYPENKLQDILKQDIQISETVENKIQDAYKRLPRQTPRRRMNGINIKTAAAALALCIVLPAAAYASAKTGFFQAMFGNATKPSNEVLQKEVDTGKGTTTTVTLPSKEYVPVDETEAEELIGK